MNDRGGLNWQVARARRYHAGTKHPGGGLFDPRHAYDPRREPRGHKVYPQAERMDLPGATPVTRAPALGAIQGAVAGARAPSVPEAADIARILHFTAGITKRLRFSGLRQPIPFRAAACTGALYHIELYLVCRDLPGIPAGVYHYAPGSHSLARLREGDHRRRLLIASGEAPSIRGAAGVLLFTDAYWRNAFKYQAREFRHTFWDSGTMAANALAMGVGLGLDAGVVLGFADGTVSQVLAISDQAEFPVLLMPLGSGGEFAPEPPTLGSTPMADPRAQGYQTNYPAIEEVFEASSLENRHAAQGWRGASLELSIPAPHDGWVDLVTGSPGDAPQDPIEVVIQRRGSSRRFQRNEISLEVLTRCLKAAAAPLPSDCLGGPLSLNHIYLIVNAVEGVSPGTYVFHPQRGGLEQLAEGDFRRRAGHLALGQRLAADAGATLFFMTDLEPVLERFGNRGYRAAQLQASIAAGRIYLAAYAQGIGATGLTFYDDAVTDFFSPHAEGKSVMFLIAIGNPA